jgi:MFS family permease
LHITDAQAGYIGSIFLLGYTIGTIGFGLAADRWGRKTTLGASIVLYGTTTALAGLTTNIAAFTGLNQPGYRAHFLCWEGWRDAKQAVRREHKGKGGPAGS